MTQARLASAQFTFAPASKTITFDGVPGFVPEGVVDVFHVPSGLTLYSPYSLDAGGTFAGNVLTLAVDTTATYGANKSYAPGDVVLVTYNDLARDDRLITYAPRATGTLAPIACASFQSCVLDVQSATAINGTLEGTVDGAQWKPILGILPNLDNNPGDTNWNQGTPYNMRQYDITAYRLIRINVQGYSAGTPTVNLLMKTVPAPVRKVIVNGGSVVANFDSGGSVGYVRTNNCYTERLRGAFASGETITGAARQAFGWPNPYYPRFEATVLADVACSLIFEFSDDNANWVTFKTVAVQAGVGLQDYMRICGQFHRCRLVNTSGNAGASTGTTFKTGYSAG